MDSLLKSLQENYQKGEFEAVRDLLLKNKDSFPKGDFHYNLGTVYSKLGNYAVGRYHLEKAKIEGNETVSLKHNLKNVEQNLSVHDISTSSSLDDVFLSKGLEYGSDFYLFLTLFIMVTGSFLIFKKYISKSLFVILFLVSLVPVSVHYFYLNKLTIAITFKEIPVYEGPSGIFEEIGKIPKGAKLVMGKTSDGWFLVEKPIDYVGWIKVDDAGVLK